MGGGSLLYYSSLLLFFPSQHGLTPINVAASSPVDATEKVELLLRHGAAPDAPLLPSAPHSAAAAPIVSAAAVPPRGVPTVSGVEDLPALMHAVITGDLAMVRVGAMDSLSLCVSL